MLLKLKDNRGLTRLVEQVIGYAALIDDHANVDVELSGVLLGDSVPFVWPHAGEPVGRAGKSEVHEVACEPIAARPSTAGKEMRLLGVYKHGDGPVSFSGGGRGHR